MTPKNPAKRPELTIFFDNQEEKSLFKAHTAISGISMSRRFCELARIDIYYTAQTGKALSIQTIDLIKEVVTGQGDNSVQSIEEEAIDYVKAALLTASMPTPSQISIICGWLGTSDYRLIETRLKCLCGKHRKIKES
jgi:hypothetical protein